MCTVIPWSFSGNCRALVFVLGAVRASIKWMMSDDALDDVDLVIPFFA